MGENFSLSPSTMSLRLLSRNFARSFRGSLQSSSRTFVQTRFYSEESGKRVGLTSVLDHATGEEKEELLTELEGKELYEQYLSGPFGTIENPVIVPSVMHTRIVGCLGGDGDSAHDLLWHEVKKDKPTICAECGQVFKLQTNAHSEVDPLADVAKDNLVLDMGNVKHHHPENEQKFWEEFEQFKKSYSRSTQRN